MDSINFAALYTSMCVYTFSLLYIKSRMLLPIELSPDDEFDDPRTELVEKLIEYQKYRKLSELMADQEKGAEWPLEREKKQNILPFVDDEIWQQVNVWDLLQSFSSLISTISSERIIDLYEEVTINEKITLINEFLESGTEFYFSDIRIKSKEKV
ncbi:Segregation and condensation protein A [subsurface metagenome]